MRSAARASLAKVAAADTLLRITGRCGLADVPMDTNHLERNLRAITMGRKNWNFCWTELGAKHVGIMHSLIVTCRLHGIESTPTCSTFSSAWASILPVVSRS